MVARAVYRVVWFVSELQMRFRRILVLFSLGLLVLALLPSGVAPDRHTTRDPGVDLVGTVAARHRTWARQYDAGYLALALQIARNQPGFMRTTSGARVLTPRWRTRARRCLAASPGTPRR
jgi:hypothetical protein